MPFSISHSPIASASAEAIFCPASPHSHLRSFLLSMDGQSAEDIRSPLSRRLLGSPYATGARRLCRSFIHFPYSSADSVQSATRLLRHALRLVTQNGLQSVLIPLEDRSQLHPFLAGVRDFLLHEDSGDLDVLLVLPDDLYASAAEAACMSSCDSSSADILQDFRTPLSSSVHAGERRQSIKEPPSVPRSARPSKQQPKNRPYQNEQVDQQMEAQVFASESDSFALPGFDDFPLSDALLPSPAPSAPVFLPDARHAQEQEIDDLLKMIRSSAAAGESFHDMLLRLIDETNQSDAAIYKRANISRKLFSKIRSNRFYQPGKNTVFAFAFALHLSESETSSLLASAGFSFSPSSLTDRAVRLCMQHDIYDIGDVNELLFQLDLKGLGA